MKKLNPFFLVIAVSVMLINSCKKDDNDARDKFVGCYSMSESWTLDGGGSGTDNYTITIAKSDVNGKQILINNLGNTITAYGAQMNVTANVEGNSLAIATQSISLYLLTIVFRCMFMLFLIIPAILICLKLPLQMIQLLHHNQ